MRKYVKFTYFVQTNTSPSSNYDPLAEKPTLLVKIEAIPNGIFTPIIQLSQLTIVIALNAEILINLEIPVLVQSLK